MIKQVSLTIAGIFLSLLPSFAQENKEPKRNENFFCVGPLDLFYNTLQLEYERKLRNHNSFALLGGFKLSKKEGTLNRIGGNGEIQYRVN